VTKLVTETVLVTEIYVIYRSFYTKG